MHGAFARIERAYGARIGVMVEDTGSGRTVEYRPDERFAFASTDKTFIAAATLQRTSAHGLGDVVHYSREDLLDYAPIASHHVADGMTVAELVDAALRYSDNTAANLLVERLGGPGAVEAFLRGIGDRTTSVDRIEPDLNSATPGDRRDTTTPRAFAADLDQVLDGAALPHAARTRLLDAMRANTTGGPYIRSGVPSTWTVADKTGGGGDGTRNDIAVVTPPHAAPIVVVLLSSAARKGAEPGVGLLAETMRAAVTAIG